MSDDFVTALRLQLREAALREERRGPLRRLLAPPPAPVAAAALALAALLAAVVVAGGLRWGGEKDRQAAPRVVADVRLAPTLGQIAYGSGAVWAADTTNGRLLRIDPRTRRVVARVPVGGAFAVGAGDGAVWTLDDRGRLTRVDPRTNRVVARSRVRSGLGRFGVVYARGAPWIVADHGAIRLDPATGDEERFIRVPGAEPALYVAISDEGLWVLTRDARLLRIDLDTGRETASMPVRLPGAVGFHPTPDGPVLVTLDGRIARASLADGRLAWERQVSAGFTAPPMLIGDTLWHHAVGDASPDRLIAFDVTTGATRGEVRLPEFGLEGAARVGGELWLATPTGRMLVIRR